MGMIDNNKIMEYLDNRCHYSNNPNYDDRYRNGINIAYEKLFEERNIDLVDIPGVCRCKDCIYLYHGANNDLFCAYKYGLKEPKETDYCSYAQRKEK